MSNKIKKKEFKQVQNQAQEGRSMVEMLGVLAIIGVLSIGGIAGYRWGMDKYVSNQILYEMNLNSAQLAMLLQKGNPDGVTLSLGSPYDEGKFRTVDYGFAYACGDKANSGPECLYLDETMYSMTATGLPKRVCNMLSDAAAGLTYASELEINGGADECDDNTGNTVTVFFDIDTTVEGGTPRPEGPETDPNSGDESQDDDPVPTECPGNTWLSADESECTCSEDEKTCNGGCCAGCEGGKIWTGKKCVCPTGAVESEEGCACSGDKPYWDGSKCTMCPEEAPWDETTKQCKCEGNKVWKKSKNGCVELVGECQSNADCKLGEYCYLERGDNRYYDEFDPNKFGVKNGTSDTSTCRNALGDAKFTTNFVGSESQMSLRNAERFCAALGRPQATLDTIKCSINMSDSACIDTDMVPKLKDEISSDCIWLAGYVITPDSGLIDQYTSELSRRCSALCE